MRIAMWIYYLIRIARDDIKCHNNLLKAMVTLHIPWIWQEPVRMRTINAINRWVATIKSCLGMVRPHQHSFAKPWDFYVVIQNRFFIRWSASHYPLRDYSIPYSSPSHYSHKDYVGLAFNATFGFRNCNSVTFARCPWKVASNNNVLYSSIWVSTLLARLLRLLPR